MSSEMKSETEEIPWKEKSSVEYDTHLKILIPNCAIGSIMGREGAIIKRLEIDSGTKISLSRSDDLYPGTKERVCLISGDIESVLSANYFIMECINDAATNYWNLKKKNLLVRARQVKMLIPQYSTPRLIGKTGKNIERIKHVSKTFIQVSQLQSEKKLLERCVIVVGEMTNRTTACRMILQCLGRDTNVANYLNVSYANRDVPVPNAFPTGPAVASSVKLCPSDSKINEEFCTKDSSIMVSETDSCSLLRDTEELFRKARETLPVPIESSYTDEAILEARSRLAWLHNQGILDFSFALLVEFYSPGAIDCIERKSNFRAQRFPASNAGSLNIQDIPSSASSLKCDTCARMPHLPSTTSKIPVNDLSRDSIAACNINKQMPNSNSMPSSHPVIQTNSESNESLDVASNASSSSSVFPFIDAKTPVQYSSFFHPPVTNVNTCAITDSTGKRYSDILQCSINKSETNVTSQDHTFFYAHGKKQNPDVLYITSSVPSHLFHRNFITTEAPSFSSAFGTPESISNENVLKYKRKPTWNSIFMASSSQGLRGKSECVEGRNPALEYPSYCIEDENRAFEFPFFSQIPAVGTSCGISNSTEKISSNIPGSVPNKRMSDVVPRDHTFPSHATNANTCAITDSTGKRFSGIIEYATNKKEANTVLQHHRFVDANGKKQNPDVHCITSSIPTHLFHENSITTQAPTFYSAGGTPQGINKEKTFAYTKRKPTWNKSSLPSFSQGLKGNSECEGRNSASEDPSYSIEDINRPIGFTFFSQIPAGKTSCAISDSVENRSTNIPLHITNKIKYVVPQNHTSPVARD